VTVRRLVIAGTALLAIALLIFVAKFAVDMYVVRASTDLGAPDQSYVKPMPTGLGIGDTIVVAPDRESRTSIRIILVHSSQTADIAVSRLMAGLRSHGWRVFPNASALSPDGLVCITAARASTYVLDVARPQVARSWVRKWDRTGDLLVTLVRC
jgi:hypothetical protein